MIEALPERRVFVQGFESLSRNPFLPVDIAVLGVTDDKETPRKIRDNIVYLKDNKFKVCKGGVRATLHGMTDPVLR